MDARTIGFGVLLVAAASACKADDAADDAIGDEVTGTSLDGELTDSSGDNESSGESTVDITVLTADPGGCFVAEITAAVDDWNQTVPPLGWVALPLALE
ncbi:MAG: hypothetical protein KC431_08710 [Myxococcales bacterium]|nr:hypothetical protein [Myxococcales bacterium]